MHKFYFFPLIVFLFALNSCMDLPEDLIMPSWDVELNVPVLNRTYTLEEFIESPEDISIEPSVQDNVYLIKTNSFNGGIPLSEYITIESETSLDDVLLPAVEIDTTSLFVPFPEGIEIEEAEFSSGNVTVSIENPSITEVTTSILFPGVITPEGTQLVVTVTTPANSINSISYQLDDCSYKFPENQSPDYRGSLEFIPSVRANEPGAYIILDFQCSDFLFESLNGKMPLTFLGTKKIPIKLNFNEIENYRDKLSLKEVTFNLQANYNSSITNPFEIALYNLRIYGKRDNGEEKMLQMINGSNINMELLDGTYNLTLNEENSNLNEFVSFLPDSINIFADFYLNPQSDTDLKSTTVLDSVIIDTDFITKASLSLKNTTITDTSEIDLSSDDRESLTDGNSADLSIEFENAIPFTAFLKIVLTDENFNPLFILTKNSDGGDSIYFSGANIDEKTGEVVSPVSSINLTSLDAGSISKFAGAYYAISYITIRTKGALDGIDNPPYVNIKSTDWIKVRCFGKVNYRVNREEE